MSVVKNAVGEAKNDVSQLIKDTSESMKGRLGKVRIAAVDTGNERIPTVIHEPTDFGGLKQDAVSFMERLKETGNNFVDDVKSGKSNVKLLGDDGKFSDPDIEDTYQEYVARKGKAGEEPRERLNWKEASDMWKTNREAGRAYEIEKFAQFKESVNEAQEQITIVTSDGYGNNVKTRLNAIGIDKSTGKVIIQEYKSSETAPLTDNQQKAFKILYESGGTVVGEGKGIFKGGYKISSGTEVEIIRKLE